MRVKKIDTYLLILIIYLFVDWGPELPVTIMIIIMSFNGMGITIVRLVENT